MALQFNYAMANDADLDDIPLAEAPAGSISDFAGNPGNQCGLLLGFSGAFMLAMLLAVGVRAYTKARILRSWSWDDTTLCGGVVGTTGVFILTCMLGLISKVGSHVWNVPLGTVYSSTWTSENDCWDVLVPLSMALVKTTFFIYMYNTFYSYRSIRLTAMIGTTFTTLFYLAITIAILCAWVPSPGQQPVPLVTPEGKALMMNTIMFVSSCGGMGLDLVIWTLPMIAVLRLEMSGRKTCGIAAIFFVGLVAILASCMNVAYRVRTNLNWDSDFLFIGMPSVLCTFIELSSGCIAASLPSLVIFHKHFRGAPSFKSHGSTLGSKTCPLAFDGNDAAVLTRNHGRQRHLHRKTSVLSDGAATITEHVAFSKLGQLSGKSSIAALPQPDRNGVATERRLPRKSTSADEIAMNATELADLDEQAQNITARSFENFRSRNIEPWERWDALKNWPPEPLGQAGPATNRYKFGT